MLTAAWPLVFVLFCNLVGLCVLSLNYAQVSSDVRLDSDA